MTRVHSHLHVYTAIPQIIIQNVIIRAVKYVSNLRTSSIDEIQGWPPILECLLRISVYPFFIAGHFYFKTGQI